MSIYKSFVFKRCFSLWFGSRPQHVEDTTRFSANARIRVIRQPNWDWPRDATNICQRFVEKWYWVLSSQLHYHTLSLFIHPVIHIYSSEIFSDVQRCSESILFRASALNTAHRMHKGRNPQHSIHTDRVRKSPYLVLHWLWITPGGLSHRISSKTQWAQLQNETNGFHIFHWQQKFTTHCTCSKASWFSLRFKCSKKRLIMNHELSF